MIEEEDSEESESISQKEELAISEESESISQKEELVISEESNVEAKKQNFPPSAKYMDVQDINAFIKEESKKFEEAENIIAEVVPEVK